MYGSVTMQADAWTTEPAAAGGVSVAVAAEAEAEAEAPDAGKRGGLANEWR